MSTRVLVVDDSPTIRKVVSAILERHGYEAVVAPDGAVALEILQQAGEPFDLVLVDFVMPRMNGFQFCRAVRQSRELRALPVVLMSAKSDKIREQFVLQTGAIDAITKPFDAQALVAVIENAIRRSETWRARGEALSAGIPDEFELPESLRTSTGEAESRRVRAAHDFLRKLAATIGPTLSRLPAAAASSDAQIIAEIAAHVPLEALKELAEHAGALDFGPGAKLALSGDMGLIPIGAVLQLLQIEGQSGTLAVTNGKIEAFVTMRQGLIDLVQARNAGSEFRLGRYFVELGLVSPEDIDALLRVRDSIVPPPASGEKVVPGDAPPKSDPSGANGAAATRTEGSATRKLLGDLLVDAGRVSKEQLREALARQSSELVYEVLRWSSGRFEFRREPPPPLAESARLGLPIASVVMEGFRRVDEWRVVEAGLGSFDAVLQRDPVAIDALGEDRIARPERTVLDAVDGERTVREIVDQSHLNSFDACKILCQFLEARLVVRRRAL